MLVAQNTPDLVDWGQPVNWSHPLNRGRVFWGYAPNRFAGGKRLVNIVRRPGSTDGVFTGTPTWKPTPYGMGLYLTNGNYATPTFSTLTEFTVAAWIYYDFATFTFPTNGSAFDGGGSGAEPAVGIEETRWIWWDGSFTRQMLFTSALTTLTWQRVIVGGKSGAQVGYLNGRANGTDTSAFWPPSSFTTLRIGTNDINDRFTGYLTDVTIWNRVLSPSEARLDFELTRANYPGALNRYQLPRLSPQEEAAVTNFQRIGGMGVGRQIVGPQQIL